MIGSILHGRYRIEKLLGEGGMGAVYEATRLDSGERVAVKVITLANLARSDEIRARFAREGRAAAAIETRHIVEVIESGTDPVTTVPYMVMELLRGEDLQHVIDRLGALPEALALRIAAQACVGLQRAHDTGIVHRDIKPANLYLSESSGMANRTELVVKLLDFGIAKVKMDELGNTAAGLTSTGHMLGTPLYMSPEQAKGLKTINHLTDIWSLGAVLYQMVSGMPPHDDDTVGQLILSICSEPPRPVQELAAWVSPEVAAILHRALRLDPADRYQRATDMLEDIGALIDSSWSIDPTMVVGVAPAQRNSVARRVVVSDKRAASSRDSMEEAGVASTTVMRTTGGLVRRLSSMPPQLRKLSPIAIGALVGGAAATGITLWLSMRGPATGVPTAESPTPPPVTETATVAPAPSSSAPSQEQLQRVQVAVPGGARAVVDGAEAPITDGSVEVSGKLGSKHVVRVIAGERSIEREVFVTEAGAVPDRLELPRATAAGPSVVPRAPGTGPAVGKTSAPPPATARSTAAPAPVATKFE